MRKDILIIGILLIGLLIILNTEGFVDFPVAHKEYVAKSQKKYAPLTNMVNLLSPTVNVENSGIIPAIQTINTTPELIANSRPELFKKAEICEKSADTCSAFNDPTFAANCGISFDINGIDSKGKPHKGGLYIHPSDRERQTAKAADVLQTGSAPYDPYKVYKPTLGMITPGTFGITKDGCTVVKEKVDCTAKQTFGSPNCSQCYTSQEFSRVGPETGRLPITLYLVGNGRSYVLGSNLKITSNNTALANDKSQHNGLFPILSSTPVDFTISDNAEGGYFFCQFFSQNGIPFMAGYIEGSTPRGLFKLDIFKLCVSNIKFKKPRISGTTLVNGFKCVNMIPNSGETSILAICMIPFTFLNTLDSDALGCDNGPMITKESSAIFLESDPCFNKANKPGAYKLECLQSRWLNMGGTEKGEGYPSTQALADAIQKDANGAPLDIDTIVDKLSVRMSKALTGKDANKPLTIPDWNTESMFATGVPINTPCDGPGAGQQDCMSFLYFNQGTDTHVGPTYYGSPSIATKTAIDGFVGDGFVGDGFTDVPPDPNAPPKTFNQPGTILDPNTPSGLAFGQQFGANLPALKQAYNNVVVTANDNTKKNPERAIQLKQAYDINLPPATVGRNDFDVLINVKEGFDVMQPQTYAQLKAVCETKGERLCQSTEICDLNTRKVIQPELTTSFPTDNWIAVGDSDNQWLTLNTGDRYCKTHTEVAGEKPAWGTTNAPQAFTRLAKCCSGTANMLGRYITLQYNHVECLNLGEIAIYSDEGTTNIITPQMKVTKSSGYSGDAFPVGNYIDGNPGTFVHTSCYDVPWITIDLGKTYPIYRIVIINRGDCCQSRILGSYLYINLDGNSTNVYTSDAIASINQTYTWFPPDTGVYGDVPLGAPPPIRQKVYGNNGSTTCERYCSGISGGPWNNELPVNWNGARCDAVDPVIGNCYANFLGHSNAPCTCVKTGTGWRRDGWTSS